jgi:hypothetical protein
MRGRHARGVIRLFARTPANGEQIAILLSSKQMRKHLERIDGGYVLARC